MMNKIAKQDSSGSGQLSPEARKRLIAAISALAGGAIGSYAAGEGNRTVGALTGAGLAGGLALSSDAIQRAVTKGMSKALPPPKSKSSGFLTSDLPLIAGAAAVPAAFQLSRPSESNFRAILNSLIQYHDGHAVTEGMSGIANNIVNDLPAINANRLPFTFRGLMARHARHQQVSALIDRAAREGVFHAATGDVRMTPWRNFFARSAPRRAAVATTALATTLFAIHRIKKRIQANRDKIDRGWD